MQLASYQTGLHCPSALPYTGTLLSLPLLRASRFESYKTSPLLRSQACRRTLRPGSRFVSCAVATEVGAFLGGAFIATCATAVFFPYKYRQGPSDMGRFPSAIGEVEEVLGYNSCDDEAHISQNPAEEDWQLPDEPTGLAECRRILESLGRDPSDALEDILDLEEEQVLWSQYAEQGQRHQYILPHRLVDFYHEVLIPRWHARAAQREHAAKQAAGT